VEISQSGRADVGPIGQRPLFQFRLNCVREFCPLLRTSSSTCDAFALASKRTSRLGSFPGDQGSGKVSKQVVGVLSDQPIVASRIKHVGKEGNELDEHDAKVIDKVKPNIECHDSEFDDLVEVLREMPTKVIADATGYNVRNVRKLKRGEFWPSDVCGAELLILT